MTEYITDVNDGTTKKYCPMHEGFYTEHPALSRKDNKTYICTDCGTLEALQDFDKYMEDELARS